MGLKVGTVKLEPYNLNWKEMFHQERVLLEKIFKNIAIRIEHVGSTSIEGLSAKPIIDIAVAVKKLNDFEIVRNYFEEEPYSIKTDSVCDEILIRKGSEDNRTHFIHVMEIDSKRYKNTILFRDYLTNHIQVLKEYENLKKNLVEKYPNDRKMYTDSKNEFIQKVINLAYANTDGAFGDKKDFKNTF